MVSEILITSTLRQRIIIQDWLWLHFYNDSDNFTSLPLQIILKWSISLRALIDFRHHQKEHFHLLRLYVLIISIWEYWDDDEQTGRISLLRSPRRERVQWSSPSWPGWNQCSAGPARSSGSEPWAATLPCSRWGWPAMKTRESQHLFQEEKSWCSCISQSDHICKIYY